MSKVVMIMVVGGRPIEPRDRAAIIPVVGDMLDSAEPYEAVATALRATPIWVFHGAKDESIPVEVSQTMVRVLRETGNSNVKYTEYENEGHQIVGRAFGEPGLIEWLGEQRLEGNK